MHSGANADSLDEIDGRDHGTLQSEFFGERVQTRAKALSPQPDPVSGAFPEGDARLVYGMIPQDLMREFHQFAERLCCGNLRQIAADDAAGNVVRRGQLTKLQNAFVPHKAMAVAHAGIKRECFAAKLLFHCLNQLTGLFGGDIVGAVIQQLFLLERLVLGKRDQIAAHGHVAVLQVNSHADGFERGAAGVINFRIVAHCGKIGYIATGRHGIVDGFHQSHRTQTGKAAHVRFVCRHHRCFAVQLLHGVIRHPVAEHDCILHQNQALSFRPDRIPEPEIII